MIIKTLIAFMFCLMLINIPAFAVSNEASTQEVRMIAIEALDNMDVGAYADATNLVTRAIEKAPNMAELYILRSECYLQQQEYKKAYSDSLKAISVAPNLAAAHHACAVSQYYDDTYGDARYRWVVEIETDAIKYDPKLADAYAYRAYANYKLKNYGDAWNDVKKLREMDPGIDNDYHYDFIYMLIKDSGGEPKTFFFF